MRSLVYKSIYGSVLNTLHVSKFVLFLVVCHSVELVELLKLPPVLETLRATVNQYSSARLGDCALNNLLYLDLSKLPAPLSLSNLLHIVWVEQVLVHLVQLLCGPILEQLLFHTLKLKLCLQLLQLRVVYLEEVHLRRKELCLYNTFRGVDFVLEQSQHVWRYHVSLFESLVCHL